jgi:hypothetical protein
LKADQHYWLGIDDHRNPFEHKGMLINTQNAGWGVHNRKFFPVSKRFSVPDITPCDRRYGKSLPQGIDGDAGELSAAVAASIRCSTSADSARSSLRSSCNFELGPPLVRT